MLIAGAMAFSPSVLTKLNYGPETGYFIGCVFPLENNFAFGQEQSLKRRELEGSHFSWTFRVRAVSRVLYT